MVLRQSIFTIVAIVIAAGTSAGDDPPSKFKEFTSKEGRFSVDFPGTPKDSKEPVSKGGPMQTQYYVDGPTGAYLVSFQDNPNLAKAGKAELEKSLVTAQATVQKATQGKLISAKEISLDKDTPGREYEFDVLAGPGGVFRSRAYMVKDRLYQVIVVGQKDFARSKDADRFLGSFRIVK